MRRFVVLLCVLVLVFFSSNANTAAVFSETAQNRQGIVFLRIVNDTPYHISCWIRDQYNFTAIVILSGNASLWYPVYGLYQWHCQ